MLCCGPEGFSGQGHDPAVRVDQVATPFGAESLGQVSQGAAERLNDLSVFFIAIAQTTDRARVEEHFEHLIHGVSEGGFPDQDVLVEFCETLAKYLGRGVFASPLGAGDAYEDGFHSVVSGRIAVASRFR